MQVSHRRRCDRHHALDVSGRAARPGSAQAAGAGGQAADMVAVAAVDRMIGSTPPSATYSIADTHRTITAPVAGCGVLGSITTALDLTPRSVIMITCCARSPSWTAALAAATRPTS